MGCGLSGERELIPDLIHCGLGATHERLGPTKQGKEKSLDQEEVKFKEHALNLLVQKNIQIMFIYLLLELVSLQLWHTRLLPQRHGKH